MTPARFIGSIALLVALVAAVGSFSAATSRRWKAGALITVWVSPRSAPEPGAALVERAMQTWTDAAAGRVTLHRAPAAEGASIRVMFVSDDYRYGETAPRVDRATGTIYSADVAINAALVDDPLLQRIIIYLTALHELGHALGLEHTDDFSTIMYAFRRPSDGDRYFGAYRRKLHSADDIGTPAATGLAPADVTALWALYDQH
jgi:matrixin